METIITIKLDEKDREVLAKSVMIAGLYAHYGSNDNNIALDSWYEYIARTCYKWLCEEDEEEEK